MAKIPLLRVFRTLWQVSYYRAINRLISALGKATLVFDEEMVPQVKQYQTRSDDRSFVEDGPLDIIRRAIEMIKGLSLGILHLEYDPRYGNELC
ncbi:hypothetical protein [Peribacillus kribbensis]|uniref:hypothetical protein n=1 Tax=Peribacillus kribbensis TaxID=356658 RepID=UPI00047D1C9E|nr:hypothetical protein [Peribacillus kribbensis]